MLSKEYSKVIQFTVTDATLTIILHFHSGIRPPTLKELLSIKTTEWFRLGLELRLEEYDLEIIEKDRRLDASGALRDVLRKWQRQCEDPTWGAVVRALREIGEGREAKRLEDKFCKL